MFHLYIPFPLFYAVIVICNIAMLQNQQCTVIIITSCNCIYFKVERKKGERLYTYSFCYLAFVFGSLHLFLWIQITIWSHFLRPNAALLPPTSFVWLLANIFLYVIGPAIE